MAKMILTVPKVEADYRPIILTGNEYLSLPEIDPLSGGIDSLNVLSMSACGLLEFRGAADNPLLEPVVRVGGRPCRLKGRLRWSYHQYWEPRFCSYASGGLHIEGRIISPPGSRGAVYLLSVKNVSGVDLRLEAGWQGSLGYPCRTVFHSKALSEPLRVHYDRWTGSLIAETGSALPLAALALSSTAEGRWVHTVKPGSHKFSRLSSLRLRPGERRSLALYLAVNMEADGAGTTAVDLKRRGWEQLSLEKRRWLRERAIMTGRKRLDEAMNRNLFFNYFFALGRSIDTDCWVPVTSRSPRYYVSAAFWGRDALLWSFPGILLVDRHTAREVLLTVFERHLARAGEHAHYINGTLLYPGFELDQLAAYFLALRHYLQFTGDFGLLREGIISEGLNVLLEKLLAHRDGATGLFHTFLDPSDDPVRHPFLVYGNALAWCGLHFLARLYAEGFWSPRPPLETISLEDLAAELRRAIYRYGVVEGPEGPLFAWAVDGEGGFQLYDNPPGSLQLLAYYGFCALEDEVYRRTVDWIRSPQNPHYHHAVRFNECSCQHAVLPWPLAAANDLLAQNREGGRLLLEAVMDSGFACETVHPKSGRAATGRAFASAAGFVGFALWRRFAAGRVPREKDRGGES